MTELPEQLTRATGAQNKSSFTVTEASSAERKTPSPNLPNHQGMSAGIAAQLSPHPAHKKQGVSKCPEEKSVRKSVQRV